MDPFAVALDAIFTAPGSIEVNYQQGSSWSRPVRTIRSQPDMDAPFGQSRIVQGTNMFEFRKSEIPTPKAGDLIVMMGSLEIYEMVGEATLDVEGLTWTIGASLKQ